jgi:hypothetical protein
MLTERDQKMELLILVIIIAAVGYGFAYFSFRDDLRDLRYRQKIAEWERQKLFWAYTYAAKRSGIDVEAEEWFRTVQEEEAEFEKQNPFSKKHRKRKLRFLF